jgi:hypothetical protein
MSSVSSVDRMQEIAMMKADDRAFQKFARRASRLTPDSTTEEIDTVFEGATDDSLSDFDAARFLCLLYGYSGIFAKSPLPYLGLLARAFDLPTTKKTKPTYTPLVTRVSYKDRQGRHRSR